MKNVLSKMQIDILENLYRKDMSDSIKTKNSETPYDHWHNMRSTDLLKNELFHLNTKFIDDQQKRQRRWLIPQSHHTLFAEAAKDLIKKGLVKGFAAGYQVESDAGGKDISVPLKWDDSDKNIRLIGITLTPEGYKLAEELLKQKEADLLAELNKLKHEENTELESLLKKG
ncbi:MAG: hypothetical protein HZC10_01860 [Nitrospirae bacterium]|nr:hypothetical protein [Nitrospirota bacterium]